MTRTVSLIVFVALFPELSSAQSYRAEVLADSPAAYWRLGEKTLAAPVVDETGNVPPGVYRDFGRGGLKVGQPGAIVLDPDTAVRIQDCIGFHCPTTGQVEIPLIAGGGPLDLGVIGQAEMTLEAWFQLLPDTDRALSAPTAFPRIIHYNHGPLGQYAFGVVGNDSSIFPDRRTVWAALGDGNGGSVILAAHCDAVAPSVHPDWHHLAATIVSSDEGTTIRLFLDGEELIVRSSDPIFWALEQASIGCRFEGGVRLTQGFPGLLDEVVVYPRALKPERIRTHFEKGRPPPVAKFSMNPVSGFAPLKVAFDAGASQPPPGGSIRAFQWRFGDGELAEGPTVEHVFRQPGHFLVTLRVESDLGTTAHASQRIPVNMTTLPANPFQATAIGKVGTLAGSTPLGECVRLFAGGEDLGGQMDSCLFLHQQRDGDFTLLFEVRDVRFQPRGRVAVMVRADLAPDAPMAAITLQRNLNSNELLPTFLFREFRGSPAQEESLPPIPSLSGPFVLCLERRGGLISGKFSPGGKGFSVLPAFPHFDPFGPGVLVGVAVSGADPDCTQGTIAATFCELPIEEACPESVFHRGDADGSGTLDISDPVHLLSHLFHGGVRPPCRDAADADDSGELDLTDAIAILDHLFLGGPPPPSPGPPGDPCGPDPTPDSLDCPRSPGC